MPRGGPGRGQGLKVQPPKPTTAAELIAVLRKHLDAKPAQKIPVLPARQLLAFLEASCPYCGSFGYDKIRCRACGWLERQPSDGMDDDEYDTRREIEDGPPIIL